MPAKSLNLIASSLGRHLGIGEGDEIVLSIMEHHSNIVPWHFWRERHGAVIKWAPVDADGNFLLDEFAALLTERTKVVRSRRCRMRWAPSCRSRRSLPWPMPGAFRWWVDGSQAAVHLAIDVQDLDADFYVFTGHKLYGPSGIGIVYGKKALLEVMPPFLGGGEMIREVSEDGVTYGAPPHRFEAGTPPLVQAIGLGAAIDYVNAIGKGCDPRPRRCAGRLCP